MTNNTITKVYRLILAALIAASLIFHLAILWESRGRIAAGYGDFIIFYTGAQIVNDGKSKELFKVDTQNAYQAKFDVPQLEWPLPFNHAPYELLLFLPLAYLSYPFAHLIWSSLNLGLLIIMLRWLLPYVASLHGFFIVAGVFAWFPTMEALRMGQDSILSAALLVAVFVAFKRNRDGWAGFLLALGLYKPQLVLPIAGILLVTRRWQSVAVFGMTGIVLVVISLAMVGFQGAFDLLSILKSMGDYSFIIYPRNMPNLRGLSNVAFDALGLDLPAGAVAVIASLALYGLCLYLWRGELDANDAGFDLLFSLAIVVTVLISYHLYAHDLFPISISLILLFNHVSRRLAFHWFVSGGFFFLLLIGFFPLLPRYLIQFRSFGWGAFFTLTLYAILAVELLRRERYQLQSCEMRQNA